MGVERGVINAKDQALPISLKITTQKKWFKKLKMQLEVTNVSLTGKSFKPNLVYRDDLVLRLLKKSRGQWMDLKTLVDTHGVTKKYKNLKFNNGAWIKVHASNSKNEFWVESSKGEMFTLSPDEAKTGWALHLDDVPVRICAWRFLDPTKEYPAQKVEFREGIFPWEHKNLEKLFTSYTSEMKKIVNWHRCESEDVVLSVVQ